MYNNEVGTFQKVETLQKVGYSLKLLKKMFIAYYGGSLSHHF